MSRWFRHYAGMMRDEKLVRVALQSKQPVERVMWVWGAILESAAEINDGGRFDFDPAEAAYFLRSDEGDIRAIIDGLAAMQRVAADRVVHWGDRQFESDRSAPRQAAYRERKRALRDHNTSQEGCNGDEVVTAESRHGDAPETETETEKITRAKARADNPDFEEWYRAYPRHEARGAAEKAYRSARKSTEASVLLDGAKKAAARYAGSDPQFIPLPATWLNQKRWLDEPPRSVGKPLTRAQELYREGIV